jgi:hypothetical protein
MDAMFVMAVIFTGCFYPGKTGYYHTMETIEVSDKV